MQIKIFINDKLYKTVMVEDTKYQPSQLHKQIKADKDAGLLESFNIRDSFKVEFRKS
jgi:hypothetical protein